MRCPNCNALNPDGAKFCSLCLTSFDLSRRRDSQDLPGPAPPPAPPAESEAVSKSPSKTGWQCRVCETINPVEADVCAACGSSLFDSLRRSEAQNRQTSFDDKNSNTAAALSILPGAGHFYLGLVGDGVVRLVLFVWWLGFAAVLPDRSGPVAFVRLTLFLCTIGLMLISAIDAYRVVEDPGTAPLLSRKLILYSSLIVVGLLVAGVFSAVLTARR